MRKRRSLPMKLTERERDSLARKGWKRFKARSEGSWKSLAENQVRDDQSF
jgi:hypothetical protein